LHNEKAILLLPFDYHLPGPDQLLILMLFRRPTSTICKKNHEGPDISKTKPEGKEHGKPVVRLWFCINHPLKEEMSMPAPKGNQFWKMRSKHGRDLIFSSPTLLWEACCEYFETTDERKWWKTEFNGKDAIECHVPTDTPYTWTGLYIFLDIDHKTWVSYESKEDFVPTCTRVRNIIYTQKFEGAAVGAFNANIISRDLGLADKQETKFNGDVNHTITGMIVE
jgi:hypothetical protein